MIFLRLESVSGVQCILGLLSRELLLAALDMVAQDEDEQSPA
jgi:hypothetical protein